jgi:hypothetical protein
MEQSSPSEDNSRSAGEDISLLLRNPKIYYRIHKTAGLKGLKFLWLSERSYVLAAVVINSSALRRVIRCKSADE